jgi:hypothetical protein
MDAAMPLPFYPHGSTVGLNVTSLNGSSMAALPFGVTVSLTEPPSNEGQHTAPVAADPSTTAGQSWAPPEEEFNTLECARLEAGIAVARQRTSQARARVQTRAADVEALLQAETGATERRLEELRRQYEDEVVAIHAAGQAYVERILRAAREYAALRLGGHRED